MRCGHCYHAIFHGILCYVIYMPFSNRYCIEWFVRHYLSSVA